MIGTMLINDISYSNTVKVDINKQYDYVTIYSCNSGNTDYLQLSDNVYLIEDLDTFSVVGVKIMDFYASFSLEQLETEDFDYIPNTKELIKQVFNNIH